MKTNKGFSLVELIVVICIMAILIGVAAPLLLVYLEKTRVSSDTQLADTVRTAITFAVTDAEIVADPDSIPFITQMETAGMYIDDSGFLSQPSLLKDCLIDYIGCQPNDVLNQLRSAHGSNCNCFIEIVNGNHIRVTLTETDKDGRKDTSSSSPENDIVVE